MTPFGLSLSKPFHKLRTGSSRALRQAQGERGNIVVKYGNLNSCCLRHFDPGSIRGRRQHPRFDDLAIAIEILPALATIRVPRHEIGRFNTILLPICPARQRLKRE